jgi:hypothetical protein
MLLSKLTRIWILVIGSCALILTFSTMVTAGPYKSCRCNPSCEVFNSPFFGYYPTCWRPWPGGQPECPKFVQAEEGVGSIPRADAVSSEKSKATGTSSDKGPREKLPPPEPEKKPK